MKKEKVSMQYTYKTTGTCSQEISLKLRTEN